MGRIDFGYILRKLRHSRDETLEQVSEATGLSVAMLSRVERGERLPSPESVEALAKHFGLSADYLMSETIAHRLVNRYGEESSNRAAEHMSREPADLSLMAGALGTAEDAEGEEADPESLRLELLAERPRRSYGPFQQQDILAALGGSAGVRGRTLPKNESPGPAQAATRAAKPNRAAVPRQSPFHDTPLGRDLAADRVPGEIDPTTERVLRAASEASEAATALVRRDAPSLSLEARLELIDRVSVLAGQAAEVLQMLAHDPDERVRDKAVRALRRLARP